MRNYHYAEAGEVMYHTGLTKEQLAGARYAVVPGDPGRVSGLAKAPAPSAVSWRNGRRVNPSHRQRCMRLQRSASKRQ